MGGGGFPLLENEMRQRKDGRGFAARAKINKNDLSIGIPLCKLLPSLLFNSNYM